VKLLGIFHIPAIDQLDRILEIFLAHHGATTTPSSSPRPSSLDLFRSPGKSSA
jgi:hypothetical protein